MMNIIVFGASGRVGSLVVAELLKRGHNVTAFVYGPDHFKSHAKLRIVRGDVRNKKDVESVVKDADAIISALGSWGTPTKNILSSAMRNIIPAMKQHGVKRIVSLTGADARDLGDKPDISHRLSRGLLGLAAGKILHDAEEHIREVRTSGLDWTVLRSPIMRDSGSRGRVKLGPILPLPWRTVNRKDVAKAMCDMAESRYYVKQSPFIYRR